ncbi:anti-sigma factor family protein [Paenibacillus senegalensis]|uniref:anti-sigma factor family protein n=1 Tax=Paenibacillus senegalensis TaxID=1465766 RepID=UPI00028A39C6|nr:zf-HC2 domain-containing protein [Paenibacillus senegalensis]
MKCADVQKILEQYMEMSPEDQRRLQVDEHAAGCPDCAEELAVWKESYNWIQAELDFGEGNRNNSILTGASIPEPAETLTGSVMNKIYTKESWRIPIADRIYSIPYKAHRNLTAFIALCIAVFVFSFLYSLVIREPHDPLAVEQSKFGFHQAVSASDNYHPVDTGLMSTGSLPSQVLIEPLKLGPIQTIPDYLVVLSFLGITAALLILNWWSRMKA